MNFATGQKMSEYTTAAQRREFENMHLNEAAEMMLRDRAQDSRMRNAGMPWWVLLCMLLSGLIIVGTGCLIVEGRQGTPRPFTTILGKIQVYLSAGRPSPCYASTASSSASSPTSRRPLKPFANLARRAYCACSYRAIHPSLASCVSR